MIWRIHGRSPFQELRRHGTRARTPLLGVAFLPSADDHPARVGYAISRRAGNAVARNRLRRRLRVAVGSVATREVAAFRGGSYLLTPAPAAIRLSVAELTDAVSIACRLARQRPRPTTALR